MKKEVKLYDIIFPTYMLLIFPMVWAIILPANFIVDSIVILILFKILKCENIFKKYKQVIVKVWLIGLLADLIGALLLLIFSQGLYALAGVFPESSNFNVTLLGISQCINYFPFKNIFSFLITFLAIAISGFFIYHFNMKKSFKNLDLSFKEKKKVALGMAIITSPYLVLLPYEWFK